MIAEVCIVACIPISIFLFKQMPQQPSNLSAVSDLIPDRTSISQQDFGGFCFRIARAPKERGRTLISQEQMQAGPDNHLPMPCLHLACEPLLHIDVHGPGPASAESMRAEEDMDASLRGAGAGGDTLGSSGMGATR
ncbi:unnamed protein product [Symbiodinium sp. CCMP2592]|nr:unnamed protein product [Symbiodinium sp. CCMP2592]